MRSASRATPPAVRLAALALLASAGFVAPAAAQQDSVSQEFSDIRRGLGFGPSTPPIDFTERPPLAVPPTYNLPRPVSGDADKLGVQDPDVYNRRRALLDPRRPVATTDPGASARGLAARTYLVDPPSGMRDPALLSVDVDRDTGTAAPAAKRRKHVRKKSAPATASAQ